MKPLDTLQKQKTAWGIIHPRLTSVDSSANSSAKTLRGHVHDEFPQQKRAAENISEKGSSIEILPPEHDFS